ETGLLRDEDSGEAWTVTPAGGDPAAYLVEHGRGYSKFEHARLGLRHDMTIFVPLEDAVKIMKVRIRNEGEHPRRLSFTYYAEWVIGVQRYSNAPYIVTDWHEEAQILPAKNTYQEKFREATAFLGVFGAGGNDGG